MREINRFDVKSKIVGCNRWWEIKLSMLTGIDIRMRVSYDSFIPPCMILDITSSMKSIKFHTKYRSMCSAHCAVAQDDILYLPLLVKLARRNFSARTPQQQ